MKNTFETVKHSPLFFGIGAEDFEKLSACVEARRQSYQRGAVIRLVGDPASAVGLVLAGNVQVVRENADGKQVLLTELSAPELFGEVFACAGIEGMPVTVLAATDCEILFLNYRKITATCSSACAFHTKLIENMLRLLAQRTLMLNKKIELLSKRTTRERLLLFFAAQGASKFTIPYNREQLATYLCVERSALSAELGRMRDEGLIDFHKNRFALLPPFPVY